jgi:hypothetical protein
LKDGTSATMCPRCCSCAPPCRRSINCTMCYAVALSKQTRDID